VHIEKARQLSGALKLNNIDFLCQDIMDSHIKAEAFDYIISHGVFSWVPQAVRNKIIETASKALKDGGLLCLSYNSLPGWYQSAPLSDLLRFHTEGLEADEAVQKAVSLLHEISEELEKAPENKGYNTEYLRREVNDLIKLPGSYLYHDYLYPSEAFYTEEVARQAEKYGLQYIGNVAPRTELPETINPRSVSPEDSTAITRYTDFFAMKRFQISLFARNDHLRSDQIKTTPPGTRTYQSFSKGENACSFVLARKQVEINIETPMVTNRDRDSIKTRVLTNLVIKYADGTKDKEHIANCLYRHCKTGELKLSDQSGKVLTGEKLRACLPSIASHQLEVLGQNNLLE
jgi:SAM-dependent methyltransferase